jgi:hypothetical protein
MNTRQSTMSFLARLVSAILAFFALFFVLFCVLYAWEYGFRLHVGLMVVIGVFGGFEAARLALFGTYRRLF